MPIASAVEPRKRRSSGGFLNTVAHVDISPRPKVSFPSRSANSATTEKLLQDTDDKGEQQREKNEFVDDSIEHSIKEDSSARSKDTSISISLSPTSKRGHIKLWRQKCGDLIDGDVTQWFILILIVGNSAMFGIATFPTIKDDPYRQHIFDIVDLIFLIIFTVELALQIFYNGAKFFKDGWLIFDFFIVSISWFSSGVSILRAFRIFRALRLVTRVEILRNVVVALLSVIPKMAAIALLLFLAFYIFAVMFTQLFKDLQAEGFTEEKYFNRLDLTLFTLFQVMCLDEWSAIAYEVMDAYSWAWTVFVSFIVMTAFVIVNLIIAVICDAVHVLRKAESALLYKEIYSEMETRAFDSEMTREKMQKKINEMQGLLDEIVTAQREMAKTIQTLSLELLKEQMKKE